MKQALQVIVGHRFTERDFVGGEAALDFINTVAGRDQSAPRDRLDSYERLLEWAAHANLLPGKQLRALARSAQGRARGRHQGAGAREGVARGALCDRLGAGWRPVTVYGGARPPP